MSADSSKRTLDGHRPMSLSDPFPGWEDEVGYLAEPSTFQAADFDDLFVHAARLFASDITLQTDEPVMASIQGRNLRITKRALTSHEVDGLVNHLYGANGVAQIRGGNDIDTRHPVERRTFAGVGEVAAVERYNFRVNITGCLARGDENGITITMRTIHSTPKSLLELGVEPEIVENIVPSDGLVCVCGPTGSGKSTLLAGVVTMEVSDPDTHKKFILIESPCEYTYDGIARASAIVCQHEVPRHLKSFSAAVRNTLRRAPTHIVVGESRDRDTIEASLEAANTGHTVFTTVHSNSVPSTVVRMANMFQPNERMTKVFEIIDVLRLVVVQRLVRRADGKGRVALREFLVFDQTVRDHLRVATDLREVHHIISKLVQRKGKSMLTSAQLAFDQGLISVDAMNIFERESQSQLIDDLGIDL
ncbi:MAG: ATPase, T2SS/T4P/T4SS family [Polaromonas sp.]|nr:ATPase, T2SS/T4P/T4SS family [Polaromonas sp.]